MNKQVQDELDLLKHRLTKLRLDEERTQHRIQANARQQQLLQERQQMYRIEQIEKALRAQYLQQQKEQIRDEVAVEREKNQKALEAMMDRVKGRRREIVDEIRRSKEINRCRVELTKAEERSRSRDRQQRIRQLDLSMKGQHGRLTQQRADAVRSQIQEEIERDAEARKEALEQLRNLESEEAKLRAQVQQLRENEKKQEGDLQQLKKEVAMEKTQSFLR